MEHGIIRRCGGEPLGYFQPKAGFGGANNVAFTIIGFKSLADYETYCRKLLDDPDAREDLGRARKSGCILVED